MGETALFYNVHQKKTLCYKNESYHEGQKLKVILTVPLATNADEKEKLTALVIKKKQESQDVSKM